jgi:hypothetical protein
MADTKNRTTDIINGWTHLCSSLGRTNIACSCYSSHFLDVVTSNNSSGVVNQTPLCVVYIQLFFLDLALRFLHMLLIRMSNMIFV